MSNEGKQEDDATNSKNGTSGDTESGVRPEEKNVRPQEVAKASARGKQQWLTDIMIIFLIISGAILLYQFNQQSERMELMKQKQKQEIDSKASTGKKGQ